MVLVSVLHKKGISFNIFRLLYDKIDGFITHRTFEYFPASFDFLCHFQTHIKI